MHQTSSEM